MKRIVSAQSMTTFGRSGNYSCFLDNIKFFVKIALYSLFTHDQWQVPSAPRMMMVDVEINIMRAIKTRVIDTGRSPHFAEILAASQCNDIAAYIHSKERCDLQQHGRTRADDYPQSLFCTFQDLVQGGAAIDKFALIFSEFCEFSLKEFLVQYSPAFPSIRDTLMQSIIFQVYFSLVVVQNIWPKFRHGDLSPHNIMVKLAHDGENYLELRRYLRYTAGSKTWNVPFFGFFIKIIDFGHSEIPEEGIISSIRHAKDIWVPDHITFLTNFEMLIEERQFITPEMRQLFKLLNQNSTPATVAPIHLAQSSSFIEPLKALNGLFGMFEVAVRKELIIKEYNAQLNDD